MKHKTLITVPEAIDTVGLDTVAWLLEDWHHRLSTMLQTALYLGDQTLHPAYDALSRSSVWEVRSYLGRWSKGYVG